MKTDKEENQKKKKTVVTDNSYDNGHRIRNAIGEKFNLLNEDDMIIERENPELKRNREAVIEEKKKHLESFKSQRKKFQEDSIELPPPDEIEEEYLRGDEKQSELKQDKETVHTRGGEKKKNKTNFVTKAIMQATPRVRSAAGMYLNQYRQTRLSKSPSRSRRNESIEDNWD